MALETGKEIVARFNTLKGRRGTFESTWQDIADSELGLREFNETHIEPGRQRMRTIYDTTALLAGHLLAGSMHGILTNPASRWFVLTVEPRELVDIPEVHEWLAVAEATADFVFKEARFGFTTAAAEFYLDLAFFGTAVQYIDDRPAIGPRFHARPLGESYVDESWAGVVDTLYRRYKMTARQFVQQFGEDADEKVTKAEKNSPGEEVKMLHLTHPRSELTSGPERRDTRPWRSVHVICDREKIVAKSGYWTNPWQVARITKEAGELYGRGPGWMALSDQKMLNEMGRILIMQSQKLMAPPLMVPDDGVLTQIDTSPDSLNVYRAGVFKEDPIRQFPVSDKTLIGEKIVAQRQEMVQRAFYSHLLQLFDAAPMTATQTLELETKAARILVSMISRVAAEHGSPTLTRVLDILERGGGVPPRPDAMEGAEVRLEYVSPVMRAQKQQEARAILNTWAAAGQIAQMSPEVLDNLDADASIRLIANAEVLPREIMVAREERDEVREMRARQQMEAAANEQFAGGAQAVGQALPALQKLLGAGGGAEAAA